MSKRIIRAELKPDGRQWIVIISTDDEHRDMVAYADNKDHALHVLCVLLETRFQRLPKKAQWDRPDKIIYYWKR